MALYNDKSYYHDFKSIDYDKIIEILYNVNWLQKVQEVNIDSIVYSNIAINTFIPLKHTVV